MWAPIGPTIYSTSRSVLEIPASIAGENLRLMWIQQKLQCTKKIANSWQWFSTLFDKAVVRRVHCRFPVRMVRLLRSM